ncbi:MAG: hypothetical protein JO185_24610 [Acidobacteriaceae bacterium]|nr:hypothetical protein [Acidobacteriaceae bacterium]
MRLITLEEHYRSPQVDGEIGEAGDYFRSMNTAGEKAAQRLVNLSDLGERRLADMDPSRYRPAGIVIHRAVARDPGVVAYRTAGSARE